MLTKPRDPAKMLRNSAHMRRQRRFSPLMLIGLAVTAVVMLIGVGVFVIIPRLGSHAAAPVNMNCTLMIPANPLTAQGLATPYQLAATDPAQGACHEANVNQSAFVQAVILDPQTGKMSAYEPLVVDQGTQPAVAPVVPQLPAGAVVGIWFGDNGTVLTLQKNAQAATQNNNAATQNTTAAAQNNNAAAAQAQQQTPAQAQNAAQKVRMRVGGRGMNAGNCVNGLGNSPFGQFGYCNAVNFFRVANQLVAAGKITIPALGTAKDGMTCPSTRDFGIVDMDQSDNVQTQYLATANGQTAQLNAANQAQLQGSTTLGNPSDNALVSKIIDPALGCTPFTIPDQVNPATPTATMATDEMEAAADQQAPIALIPSMDDFVLVNGQPNLNKINAYRVGVDQNPAATLNDASTTTYCQNIVNVALPRLNLDMQTFQNVPSPDGGATANSLFTFLANRLNTTLGAGGLNCVGALNIQNPVALTTDGNGVVTAATITAKPLPANGGNGNGNTGNGAGGVQQVATGGATINLDTAAGNAPVALNITYPNHPNQSINVNVVTNSCMGTAIFTQQENTDGNSQNMANAVINNLQGVQAIPNNWFFTVTDPAQNNMVVGCGSVAANGTTGTATLGTVAAACNTTTPAAGTTPVATPVAGATPAVGTTPVVGATPAAGATPVAGTTPASTACTQGTGNQNANGGQNNTGGTQGNQPPKRKHHY
ncbi:hypothetical protein [Dictyobacter kobayashii]|uniref:Uncharacterized protein n=1 Tax=Dictyobacter kobayashii TaxID=2014872 RepID=A0A402ANB2_9CHLR|nr:hypothetical protein [Dictyobacter kobayashii]GCE20572.1 hypothetical protein KDK_43720 [Dictyobacter kobayashii]